MIQLNYRDAKPIYEQIKDNLRKLIVSKALRENEKLPSVRDLATSLAINPNTIQRAYRELENEGYIYTIPGKGSFAAQQGDIQKERIYALLRKFDETSLELFYLDVKQEALVDRLKLLEEKGEGL